MKRILILVGILSVVFFLIQLVPFGRDHTNPPVLKEPSWDSPQTRALAKRACFDCHSNETTWPWYSQVAPASWLVANDVVVGRDVLNFSEWQAGRGSEKGRGEDVDGGDASRVVLRGYMPPSIYLLLHPEADLGPAQRQQLADGLKASLK